MADYYIELGVEQELNFFKGDGDDPHDEEHSPRYDGKIKIKTCTRCGATGLHWGNTNHGWRLHDQNGGAHNCHNGRNEDPKPMIGRITLGRRTVVKHARIMSNCSTTTTNSEKILRRWCDVKEYTKNNTNPGHYVIVTTTECQGMITWIAKVVVKKIKS